MDPHLRDAISNRCYVSKVPCLRRADASNNTGFGNRVTQRLEPSIELGCAEERDHGALYPVGYITVKSPSSLEGRPNALN